ncbi:MAG TPA: FadR/GntR family transcriptional regulator [Pseudonocardiaceae bacterium]|jgi:DNA-binding FadR family transcriptional regulator|nr:FadR/GntR family transcriptional regulator [Pseudonocardiaceae bacterium]
MNRPAPRDADDLFNPVTLARASQAIVDQIRELIQSGQLRAGERLPSERDLCERFGVSRVTVREALRILEAGGLVTVKVGARGGAYITTPSSDRVGRGIEDYLTMSPSITPAEVTEARLVLEVGIVPIVCERATEEDIDDLLALCDKADASVADGTYTMEMSTEFHLHVARLAHNGAIEMLLGPFSRPMLSSLKAAREAAPIMGALGVKEHRRFVHAVRDRDVPKATELMKAHLERTASRVRQRAKAKR